jgi:hypothetical protein
MAEIDHAPPKIGGNRFSPEASKCPRPRSKSPRIAAQEGALRSDRRPGITKGAASKSFYRSLRRIPEAFADQVRKEELESLERMEARVWRKIDRSGQKTSGIYQGIDRVLATKGRRSQLLGLDSPTEITLRSDDEASAAKKRQQMLGRLTPVEQLRLLELMTKMRNENEVKADRGKVNANEIVDIRGTDADLSLK